MNECINRLCACFRPFHLMGGGGGGGVRVYVHTVQIGEDMCISECAKRGRGLYLSASLSHTV